MVATSCSESEPKLDEETNATALEGAETLLTSSSLI